MQAHGTSCNLIELHESSGNCKPSNDPGYFMVISLYKDIICIQSFNKAQNPILSQVHAVAAGSSTTRAVLSVQLQHLYICL